MRWIAFWKELKPGYDWFERERRPPDVRVENGLYAFRSDDAIR